MNSASQFQLDVLSKRQQRLLTEMSTLYKQSDKSLAYFQDVSSGFTNISQRQLSMNLAAMAFNLNILSGKTDKLISSTILLSDPRDKSILYYCYGLTGRPWEFVVHSTFYNLPVALVDIRKWQIYKDDRIAGVYLNLNIIALKLKTIVLRHGNSNRKARLSLVDKSSLLASTILLKLYLYVNLLKLFLKKSYSNWSYLSLLKYITLARPLLNLTPIVDSIQSELPREEGNRVVLLSKETGNFGHHIWNDALGIVTTSQYIQMPQNLFLVEGPHDFTTNIQLLKTAVPTYKLSLQDMRGDFYCSYPVLALRAYPVLRPAASQLAIQLTNENPSLSSIQAPNPKASSVELRNATNHSTPYVIFTLRLGPRPWVNSLEAILIISQYLAKLNPRINFLIDGMTRFTGMKSDAFKTMHSEITLSSEVQRKLQSNGHTCHVITGLDLQSKMKYYNLAALFIQTIGSGDIIPHLILRKPIISFGPLSLIACQHDIFKAASGNMPPFIALEVNSLDGKVVLGVNDLETKEGYTVNPELVIKSIMENKELVDLFAR